MASRSRQASVHVDRDGVRIVETPRTRAAVWALLAVGLPILLTAVAVAVIRLTPATISRAPQTVPAAESAQGRAPSTDVAGVARARVAEPVAPEGVAAAPPKDAVPQVPPSRSERVTPRRLASVGPRTAPEEDKFDIDARDAIPALIAAGERGGITVFPLPGTDPPKPGVIVPESFPLPEGFVRHYQTTDDGERLPAILMVHPDYQLVDEHGAPVIAPGGVVPAELAPAGMPVQMLEPHEKPRASDPAP